MQSALPGILPSEPHQEPIGDGAVVLRGFATARDTDLLRAIASVEAVSPFRQMVTPGGYTMSVAMTNCGTFGWVTDRSGYRYQRSDPLSGETWPVIPAAFLALAEVASTAAGYPGFTPDACLINRYEPGARLSLHQDRNEQDMSAPIVSVSLGLPAMFLFGGLRRNDRPRRIPLEHGDVVVWGGATRLAFHGVDTLADGLHPLTGRRRFNLTLRRAAARD